MEALSDFLVKLKSRAKITAKHKLEDWLWSFGLDVDVRRANRGYPTRDEYTYGWLQARGFATILDIGAHEGRRSELFRTVFPNADLHAFEPVSASYAKLVGRMGNDDCFWAYNYALGDWDGVADFHQSEASETSSTLAMAEAHKRAYPHTARTIETNVEMRRLDSIVTRPLRRPVLAKIDVQGGEAAVIRGGLTTLAQVDLIIVETSFIELYAGQPLFHEIYTMLTELGFEYAGSFNQLLHPADRRVLQQDAIFTRRPHA
jgi:FkbM family methyltransferase